MANRTHHLYGEQHPGWKGDEAKSEAKHRRARRRFCLSQCELCESPATDRHHKDGNPGNNEPENIQKLCRRCHMVVDGRLDRLVEVLKKYRQTKPRVGLRACINCARMVRIIRKGRCGACNEYHRRNGHDIHPPDMRLKARIPCHRVKTAKDNETKGTQ